MVYGIAIMTYKLVKSSMGRYAIKADNGEVMGVYSDLYVAQEALASLYKDK